MTQILISQVFQSIFVFSFFLFFFFCTVLKYFKTFLYKQKQFCFLEWLLTKIVLKYSEMVEKKATFRYFLFFSFYILTKRKECLLKKTTGERKRYVIFLSWKLYFNYSNNQKWIVSIIMIIHLGELIFAIKVLQLFNFLGN